MRQLFSDDASFSNAREAKTPQGPPPFLLPGAAQDVKLVDPLLENLVRDASRDDSMRARHPRRLPALAAQDASLHCSASPECRRTEDSD
ncbi:unnamed protein product [Urochloa humidicola]